MLLKVMDPQNTGDISFLMFCRGIETFLMGKHRNTHSSLVTIETYLIDTHTPHR